MVVVATRVQRVDNVLSQVSRDMRIATSRPSVWVSLARSRLLERFIDDGTQKNANALNYIKISANNKTVKCFFEIICTKGMER